MLDSQIFTNFTTKKYTPMRNCDIKFVNKEITLFGGLSLFFKMLEKCHFEEHIMQSGIPLQGSTVATNQYSQNLRANVSDWSAWIGDSLNT